MAQVLGQTSAGRAHGRHPDGIRVMLGIIAESARNPPALLGFRRRGGICQAGSLRRCAPTSPALRRLAFTSETLETGHI